MSQSPPAFSPHTSTSTIRRIVETTTSADWSQLELVAALRCTIGVAIPLLLGLVTDQPEIAVFGAVGALPVGFGSFQGAYRSRAAIMLAASLGVAASIAIGTLAGHTLLSASLAAAAWGFGSGLLVALGPAASFVGLQSALAALVAGGFPGTAIDALWRFVIVLAGGLVQTLLVMGLWPLRRFPAERRTVAIVYRSLAGYAAVRGEHGASPPEPHTFATLGMQVPDPQPFAKFEEIAVFRALLDEGERLRTSLAGLARERAGASAGPAADDDVASAFGTAIVGILSALADAVEEARAPVAPDTAWETLNELAPQLDSGSGIVPALLGQLRAAWRTAAFPAGTVAGPPTPAVPSTLGLPVTLDDLNTLLANLTLRSTACRHALRLAVTLAAATAASRYFGLSRGYWLSITVLLVLKPDYHETFTRGVARMAGTFLGAVFASALTIALHPRPGLLTVLVLVFVWCGYAVFRASFTLFTVCITGYIVFLVSMTGVPEISLAIERTVDTVLGGVLALAVYRLWPTWESHRLRELLAELLEAQGRYGRALLHAITDPSARDDQTLARLRSAARLARSNAEASADRMMTEPETAQGLDPQVARGILAAVRRYALGALALTAGLEGSSRPQPAVETLAGAIESSLRTLAAAVRDESALPELPPLRRMQLALAESADPLVVRETDLMVDAIDTIEAILRRGRPIVESS